MTGTYTEINTFYRINRVDSKSEVRDTKVSIERGVKKWTLFFPWFGSVDLSQIPEDKRHPDDNDRIKKMKNTWKSLTSGIRSNPKTVRYEISVQNNSGLHTLVLPPTRYDREDIQLESIFLDLDLKNYSNDNTGWKLEMYESRKILENIDLQVKPLKEGGTLLELFPEKERSSYKIKISGSSGHEFHFGKITAYKGKQVSFSGKILKSFSSFEPLPEKIKMEWEIALPEILDENKENILDNEIKHTDLPDIIKMEFPNLNIPYSPDLLRIKNFFEDNASRTIYVIKEDNDFKSLIELEHSGDRLISIQGNHAYFVRTLHSANYDKDQKLLFALSKDKNSDRFTYKNPSLYTYTHTPVFVGENFPVTIDTQHFQKYKDHIFVESYSFPVVYREEGTLNTIKVFYKIEKMQEGEINLILHSIKGLPLRDEPKIERKLNNPKKNIDEKINELLSNHKLKINTSSYKNLTVNPTLYLEFNSSARPIKRWYLKKSETSFKAVDETEQWIPLNDISDEEKIYWKNTSENQNKITSIYIQNLNQASTSYNPLSVRFLTDNSDIFPQKGLFYDIDDRLNRYLAGIEKEWIDNKGKKLTDIKDLIGRSKHTAVISLVGYSSGNNPISAWYETQNEKYYATDLKKPCYLWHTKEKLLVYDQETKSIYFLNNDEKNPREGDRFSQISDKEIILKGVHNPYTEDNRIILEIEFSLWDDQSFGIQKCAFIYDFWPEKTFGEKYEATLIGIEETYIKDKYNLSAHKLGEIISNVNEENANRKDISWNIHPYISLGQYGFYFIEEKTFALPGENSRRQNLLPLGIIKRDHCVKVD